MENKLKIVTYKNEEREMQVKLDSYNNTIWATPADIAKLYNVGRNWITRQITIEEKKETFNESVCSKREHTGCDGKVYKVKHYLLDLIIEI